MEVRRSRLAYRVMTSEKDLVQSLLCAFGIWYNSSGLAERHNIRLFTEANGTDLYLRQVELFTMEWHIFLPPAHSRLLQLGPILGFLAVGLVSPVILAQILTRPQMRQETRYLLLANALFGDLLFVSGYVLSTCLNTAGVLMSDWACATVLFLLGAVYSSGILSTQAMVLDTTVAVLVPLRYFALWPVSRTKRAVVVIWAVSVVFPAGSVGVFMWYNTTAPCALHICSLPLLLVLTVSHSTPMQISMLLTVAGIMLILLLVFVGYVVLHWRTRMARVWRGERSSRAKGTFLMHYLHLSLSFCPMLVLAIELLLYCHQGALDLQANLWLSLVMCNVLVMLPKVLAPYMYSLRYRELRGAVLSFYGLRKQAAVRPVM